ncbi:MAG TPA: carboxypeptidase regulatory-like domain-containing protein [Vicinamibacterales bacterium]
MHERTAPTSIRTLAVIIALLLSVGWANAQTGAISGTVTSAATGLPINGFTIGITVYTSSGGLVGGVWSDTSGVYTMSGLTPGTYYVRISPTGLPGGYLSQIYNGINCGNTCPAVTTGAPVTVTASVTTPNINFSLLTAGFISGTVRDAQTSAPLSNVRVYVYLADGSQYDYVTTLPDGTYRTYNGLATGTYYLRTWNWSNYIDQLYAGTPCPNWVCSLSTGTPVSVTAGSTTAGRDFALAPGGSISGTVTAAGTGTPLASLTVSFYNSGGSLLGSVTTNASGAYATYLGLPSGSYYLKTSGGNGYAGQVYSGQNCGTTCPPATMGTAVQVTAPQAATGVDFALVQNGQITGTVTAAGTGTPIQNASVVAYSLGRNPVSTVTTNASGIYTHSLPPGQYYVRTSNVTGYIDQLYPSLACPASNCYLQTGTPITVAAGAPASNIDFSLAAGGAISGTVTGAVPGTPLLSGVTVTIYDVSGYSKGTATTGADGTYTAAINLPTGSYYAKVTNSPGWAPQVYSAFPCPGGSCPVTNGTPIPVTAGATRSGVSFALAPTGQISGTVRAAGTLAPLTLVSVSACPLGGGNCMSSSTDAGGAYAISGLSAATYYLRTSNYVGYVDQLYPAVTCPNWTCSTSLGAPVVLTSGGALTGKDFTLSQGATVLGSVTAAGSGLPIANVTVDIYNDLGWYVDSTTPGSLGGYTTTVGLPPGTYYARANANSSAYQSQNYQAFDCGASCPSATMGTPLTITGTTSLTNINFALTPTAGVTGTVRSAATGAPIAGVLVHARSASGIILVQGSTNSLGAYTLNVPLTTGTVYVTTANPFGYIDQIYGGGTCVAAACSMRTGTGVPVAAGATVSGIDFSLATGGGIAGLITTAGTGVGLANVSVTVFSAAGTGLTTISTDSSGAYTTVIGLPTGSYYVRTSNSNGYVDQLHSGITCRLGSCTVLTGTPVAVVAGATSSVNFSLARGGAIQGTVRAAGTGAPLPGISVSIYSDTGAMVGSFVTTDVNGVFATNAGLTPGNYFLRTEATSGYINQVYSGLTCASSCPLATDGTPVAVTAGATTSGIAFTLPATATISGTITAAGSGSPIAGVTVNVLNSSGYSAGSAVTNGTGAYVTTVPLVTGTYYLRTVNALGYVDQVSGGRECPFSSCSALTGQPIGVTAGVATTGVDFALGVGGIVTGTVTAAGSGARLAGVSVTIASSAGSLSTTTNAAGVYATQTGLPTGTYFAMIYGTSGYLGQLYGGQICGTSCPSTMSGQPFAVTAPQTTSGIDFSLAAGGIITGTVRASGTNDPLAGVSVSILNSSGGVVNTVGTNGAGVYRTTTGLPTGTYYVRTASQPAYIGQIYTGADCPAATCPITLGTPVPVTAGGTTASVDFLLKPGGRITGTVVDAATLVPLTTTVMLYDSVGVFVSSTSTSGGVYTTPALPNGSYFLKTSSGASSQYVDQLYNGLPCRTATCLVTNGTPVSITTVATVSGINFALPMGGAIRGTVTAAGSGAPLVNVPVVATTDGGAGTGSTVYTDSNGVYMIPGLPTGGYFVKTNLTAYGYFNQIYSGLNCSTSCQAATDGTLVGVTAGSTTSGINFALTGGGSIAGTVRAAGSGTPIPGVTVQFYNSSGASLAAVLTNSSGVYATDVPLPTGLYYLRAYGAPGYVDQLYAATNCVGTCTVTSGAAVPVNAGVQTTGVDFALSPAGTISGIVTAASGGAPLSGVQVGVYTTAGALVGSTTTNTSGVYATSLGLATGLYYVRAGGVGTFVGQLYGGAACPATPCTWTSGTPVAVTSAVTTPGIDIALVSGGQVTGTVTAAGSSTPLPGVVISVYSPTGSFVSSATTVGNGSYAVQGVLAGSYYVRTTTATGYIHQIYSGVNCGPSSCPFAGATTVAVTAGGTTPAIDFALAQGGVLTGAVTAADTGLPIAGSVRLYDSTGTSVTSSGLNSAGVFSIPGLPTGTYYLFTSNASGYVDRLYADLPCVSANCVAREGTPIAVTAGATTGGINFVLSRGGFIGGTVTAAATGASIYGVAVGVYNASGTAVATVATDTNGLFTTAPTGLLPGAYYVKTQATVLYLNQVYSGVICGTSCPSSWLDATPVTVTAGTTTSGIDFALGRGGSISGTVRTSGGTPLPGVGVVFFNSSGSNLGRATTNASGAYTTNVPLPAGIYYLRTVNAFGSVDQLYSGVPCADSSCSATGGTPVTVAAGQPTTGVDFSLSAGGGISGTVTRGGLPVAGASVAAYWGNGSTAYTATTDASGAYVIPWSLAAGSYYVRASVAGSLPQVYPSLNCPTTTCYVTMGTLVPVAVGATTTGIDFALAPGGRISGKVTAAGTGTPLSGVSVSIYTVSGSSTSTVETVTTGGDGIYTSTGTLGTGSYAVRAANSGTYLGQVYGGASCAANDCRVAAGALVPVTAGATTSNIDFALVQGGQISGTIALPGSPGPVSVCVYVYNNASQYISSNCTTTGVYTTGVLAPGQYYLQTYNSAGALDQAYNGVACPRATCSATIGTPVTVTAGATTSGINFSLPPGGLISGTVTAAGTGAPVSGVSVQVVSETGSGVGSYTTDANGFYMTSGGLPTGTYFLTANSRAGYFGQVYHSLDCGTSCTSTVAGTPVSVTLGAITSGIDFALPKGGSISGTVTAAIGGAPLAGVRVYVYTSTGSNPGSWTTNDSGRFSVDTPLEAGTYYLRASSPQGFVDQLYGGTACPGGTCTVTTGTPVTVAASTPTTGINFALSQGAGIKGTVTAAGTGAPLAGISVTAYGPTGTMFGSAVTNGNGAYSIPNVLAAGDYYLQASNALGYLNQIYNQVNCGSTCPPTPTGAVVAVTAGAVRTGIDFSLTPGGSIAGTVTEAATGRPVSNASVYVYDSAGNQVQSPRTNVGGVYTTTTGLAAGTYYLRTSAGSGYIDKVYANATCPAGTTCHAMAGTAVVVTLGAATSNINFSLDKGGGISGTVTDAATGVRLTNVEVDIYDSAGSYISYLYTDSFGTLYTASGLATGTYYLRTYVYGSDGYLDQVYSGLACGSSCSASGGTPVSVTAGATTSGVDFALVKGGTVSGTVREAGTNLPLAGVNVSIYAETGVLLTTGTTNGAGFYRATGIPAGTYFARTTNSKGYVDVLYPGTACGTCIVTKGTPLAVTAGNDTGGIDFTLPVGGSIAGTITDEASHLPLKGVSVVVYDGLGRGTTSVVTDAAGAYSKTGLATGNYFIRTSNSLGYVDERFDNAPCPGASCIVVEGTPIAVTAGSATTGKDIALAMGGSIVGKVTSAATGFPLPSIYVYAYDSSGRSLSSVRTNAVGVYTRSGLPAGNYYLYAYGSVGSTGYVTQVYSGVACPQSTCSVTKGTGVTVAAGVPTTGIDFAMDPAGVITGTVTRAGNGTPLMKESVYVYNATGQLLTSTTTDGSGTYRLTGLATGSYYVWAGSRSSEPVGYIGLLYPAIPCPNATCVVLAGTPVAVSGGATTANINFALAPSGTISGAITDGSSGAPVVGASVSAWDQAGKVIATISASITGTYTLSGLPTGTYFVKASNTALGYVGKVYAALVCPGSACSPAAGTPVAVTAGAATPGINIALSKSAGSISGLVTDAATGGGIAGSVTVNAYDVLGRVAGSTPVSSGSYTITGLPVGTYRVATANSVGWLNRMYSGVACAGDCDPRVGTPVAVAASATTWGIDFALTLGGSIKGTVTDKTNGALVLQASVQVYNGTGALVATTQTTTGSYALTLPAGTYFLRTTSVSGYSNQVFSGVACPGGTCPVTSGTPVSVVVETMVPDVNFVLDRNPLAFTDDPLQARMTTIKAAHVTELRQRIDDLRVRYSLPAFSWSDAPLAAGATRVKAAHIAELRTALDEVYDAAVRLRPTYTGPAPTAGTAVSAVHITEVRAAIADIW